MKTPFQFKRIQTRYSFWFVVIAMLPLLLSTGIIYKQRVSVIKYNQFQKLTGIRDLKVRQLNSWIDERESDLKSFSQNKDLRAFSEHIEREKSPTLAQFERENAFDALTLFNDLYLAYHEIFIVDPLTAEVDLSTNRLSEGKNKAMFAYFSDPLESGGLVFTDIYLSPALNNRPGMTYSIPLKCLQHSGAHITGILVARVDLEHSLYPLLQDRTAMGETGETLIVSKDEMALNELRYYENAPLNLHISAEPAVNAVAGRSGIIEDNDYRGEPVLAAFTQIKRTGWGFVAKQDQKEVYTPIDQMLINMLIIILVSAIGVYIFSYFISRTTSRPIMDMVDVAKRIGKKDYSARVDIKSIDETSILANYMNQSTAATESQVFLSDSLASVTNTFVDANNLAELEEKLLQQLLTMTNSKIAGLHILNAETGQFEPRYSIGFKQEKIASFNASSFEGEFGAVLSTKKICRSSEISEETNYIFKSLLGNALPEEIIHIPIIVNNEVSAIISLASLTAYSGITIELIQQSWIPLNTGFANTFAEEEIYNIASELGEKNQELESLAEEFKSQADELQEQNVELEEQRKHVESINQLKSEFLSNMSHELRTPLNSILSLTGVLKQQTVDKISDEESKYLEVVERNGKQLLELINDILDLSKIESGQMELTPSTVSISGIVTDLVDSIQPIAKGKGIDLVLDADGNIPKVTSDEFLVYRIIQNLLSNAVKFTEQGEVVVKVQSQNGSISVAVKDTGIGIPAQSLALIFEEFRQVDGTTSRKFEGTGLGLAIAKRSSLLLGGDIQVESIENEGSTFTLVLPLEAPETLNTGNVISQIQSGKMETSRAKPVVNAKEIKLLIVEDQEPAILLLSSYIEQAGFTADIARGGQEAIDYCEGTIPDGIILDLMMPEVDGFQVLETIRSRPETSKTPVLILTAKDLTKQDLNRLSANNVQQLVQKGDIDKHKFLEKIDIMLGVKRKTVAVIEQKPKTSKTGKTRKISAANLDKLSVLIVEDNPDNMLSIKAILPDNYTILEATDGVNGLEMISSKKPDLVLMDIMLPGMDGMEVISKVRANKSIADIPVIAVTAKAMKGDKESILEAGFDDYISKPIDAKELNKKIQSVLSV